MGKKIANICDKCGKAVIKGMESDSTDMVEIKALDVIYLSDKFPLGKHSRATLELTGCHYCPACLVARVLEWTQSLDQIEPSHIHVYEEKE